MNTKHPSLLLLLLPFLVFPELRVEADSLVFTSGRIVTGTVLQTNAGNVLMLTDLGALNYSPGIIKEIRIERAEALEPANSSRIPTSSAVVVLLSQQPWATQLKQIPSTVIENGVLARVPYVSFKCGGDYEINIYGDPEAPACVEAGLCRGLVNDASARTNCIQLLRSLLRNPVDRAILPTLSLEKDLKTFDGLTFEITPPTAPDAFEGWWVSLYSESTLELARASEAELQAISVPMAGVKPAAEEGQWDAKDLRLARSIPPVLSFVTASGVAFTNVQVKVYIEGVSIIWRGEHGSGGVVQIADLDPELQKLLRYDPKKAAAAEAAKAAVAQQRFQPPQYIAPQRTEPASEFSRLWTSSRMLDYGAVSGSSPAHPVSSVKAGGSGGSVYVKGYYRKNGTYVSGYTRRR